MHVLFLSSWFPDERNPFNGNFVIKHAEAVALYNNVSFISVTNNPLHDKSKLGIAPSVNIVEKVYRKNTWPVICVFVNGFRVLKSYWSAYCQVKSQYGKPHVVHGNIIFPIGIIAVLLKWIFGIPFIMSEHWTLFMNESATQITWWKKLVIRWIIGRAERVCPVSEALCSAIKNIAPNGKLQIVPNVVDTHLYSTRKAHTGFKFVHISSLNDAQKNVSGLLEGVALLKQKNSCFTFHIVSCGDITPFVQKANEMGLSEHLFFHQQFTPVQIADFLAECDCLVMFSRVETFGVVVIEAFAAGLPVIATHAGVMGELVKPEHGLIVPNGNVDALCNAMFDVMQNPQQFDSEKIRAFVQNRFSYNAVGQVFNEIYQQVAGVQ